SAQHTFNSRHSNVCPCALQTCRQHCSIHSPMTIFRRRVVTPTPPSLVKFSHRASAVTTGASSSVPTRDHVPELRNAVPSRAEMAATADPVSWVAGAITDTGRSEEHTSELQSRENIVCRLLLEKKNTHCAGAD